MEKINNLTDTEFSILVESRKKSGIVSALLNLALPGAGYAYCGRWGLGIAAFILVCAIAIATFGFAALGLVLVLIVDGFLCANRYNKELVERLLSERRQEA